jgi:glutamine cyclotransferase
VLAGYDFSALFPAASRGNADVLNGIAQLPGTDRFLLTGKYWPSFFEVKFP